MEGPLTALEHSPVILLVGVFVTAAIILLKATLPRKRDMYDYSGPISANGCDALAVHKYKASDYTILDNLLNPWWTWCASLLPKTLAPNVVTLLGWMFYIPCDIIIICSATTSFPEHPRWVYGLGAWAIFWYQTFDAMDGKQARALGVAGPLGQIVDHGCDAISTVLVTVICSAALRLDTIGYILLSYCLITSFYMANWAEKYTHVLMASVSKYLGVTEGQYIALSILAMPAIFGPQFWLTQLQDIIGYQDILHSLSDRVLSTAFTALAEAAQYISYDLSVCITRTMVGYDINTTPIGWFVVWFCVVSSIYMIILSLFDVANHIGIDTRKEYEELGKDTPSTGVVAQRVVSAFLELIPFITLLIMGALWYNYSLPNPSLGKNWQGSFFFHEYCSLVGVCFLAVHIICQSIINSMAYQQNHIFQPTLIPMFALMAIDIIPSFLENPEPLLDPLLHFVLYMAVILFSIVAQVRWAIGIIQQIANLFGIYILRLGPKVEVAPVVKLREQIEARLATNKKQR